MDIKKAILNESEEPCCGADCDCHKTNAEVIEMESSEDIHELVRDRYGKMAKGEISCCGTGCCSTDTLSADEIARELGYRESDLEAIPIEANLGLGCGNPLKFADVKIGETVLDLGSGAGMDAFLAAKMVSETGRVIGVDMTSEMLNLARSNARQIGITNVEFRLGEIENLPVADNSIDLITSNCVVNLSPDKPQVFQEAFRVLKKGGRILVSDLVLKRPLSPTLKNSVEAYVGCIAGASQREEYLSMMREAGFSQVEIVDEHGYNIGFESMSDEMEKEAVESIVSVKVRGVKI